jgi:uncharacterized protein
MTAGTFFGKKTLVHLEGRVHSLNPSPAGDNSRRSASDSAGSECRQYAESETEIFSNGENNMINANIPQILEETKTIAVVGISDNPSRASYSVSKKLLAHGYTVVPVNPVLEEWNGMKVYPDLESIPGDIDMVDIFRRSEFVSEIVDEAIAKKVKTVWMQLGVIDEASAQRAEAAGLNVVMDRCTAIELAA